MSDPKSSTSVIVNGLLYHRSSIVTDRRESYDEIKRNINSRNTFYYAVQKLLLPILNKKYYIVG
jgi:hypothetical protein